MRLLDYFFKDIDWDFNKLTDEEKEIVQSQAMLDHIRRTLTMSYDEHQKLRVVINAIPDESAKIYLHRLINLVLSC